MKEQDISLTLYGALRALVTNREYFYDGTSPHYSQLTERGKVAALEIVCLFAPQISEAVKADILEQSKKIVFSTLKDHNH